MFVGHGLLAFSLVAGAAALWGSDRRRALALGVVAAVFATIPDVDMAYALVGVAGAGDGGPLSLATAFWSTGNVVHRAVTHSLLVAPVAAVATAAWVAGSEGRRGARALGAALLAALVVAAGAVSGLLGAVVMALFAGALLAVAAVLVGRGVGARATLATAFAGLVSHPFGDLFTGEPPALLYPLDATLVAERVVLAPDPTVHLLAAFGLELATAWLAVLVVARLYGVRVAPAPRATVGVGYAAALPLVPAPTLDLSYPFVFSVLGLGVLVLVPGLARALAAPGETAVPRAARAARAPLTGLAAVTLAWAAYGLAYAAL
ncbi:MAG: metal-dependent hydrolase [Haloferacaceae archaeon]